MAISGLYATLSVKRAPIHGLSFLAFTVGFRALSLIPLVMWDVLYSPPIVATVSSLLSLADVAIFPSTPAFLCYNRGVQLVGANRSAPFFHLIERPELFHAIGFALVRTGVFVAARK